MGSTTGTTARVLAGIALLAGVAAPATATALTPGDLLATEYVFGGGQVVEVDRGDGTLGVVSGPTTPDAGAAFNGASATAFEADGNLVVVSYDDEPSIVRVDPRTGRRTLVSGPGRGTGPALQGPADILVRPDGMLVALEYIGAGAVLLVDPATGDRRVLSGPGVGSGPDMCLPAQVVRDPSDGALFVVTDRCGSSSPSRIFRVDGTTGARTVVWETPAGERWNLYGLGRRSDGILLASDFGAGFVVAIDPVAGTHAIVSSDAVGAGPDIGRPLGLDVATDGTIFTGSHQSPRQILRITPTGDRTLLVDGTTSTPPISEVSDIVVVPDPPAFDGPATLAFTAGEAAERSVRTVPGATGQRATSVTVTGTLPAGLTVEPGTDGAVVRGTPTETGRFEVTATLSNAAFRVTRTYVIEVAAPPPVVEGPAPAAPASPVAPAATPPAVVVPVPPTVAAQGPRATCRSARRVTINLMPPRGARLRATVVRVNGKVVRRLGGRTARFTLSFAGRPPGAVRVDLAATTVRGTRLAGRRTYRLCDAQGIPRIPLRPLRRTGAR